MIPESLELYIAAQALPADDADKLSSDFETTGYASHGSCAWGEKKED